MREDVRRVLVFHAGTLGDTILSVPALWAIRDYYPKAQITLLCDSQLGQQYVTPRAVLNGSGLIDRYISYRIGKSLLARVIQLHDLLQLLRRLRRARYDVAVYLVRAPRSRGAIRRDMVYFYLANIRTLIGANNISTPLSKSTRDGSLWAVNQADQYLMRLAESGISTALPGYGKMNIGIGDDERRHVDEWLKGLRDAGGRTWVGVGIGGKKPVTLWPTERYYEVIKALIHDHNIWPVVFGGEAEVGTARDLVGRWGAGYVAAGSLGVRDGISALSRCAIFIGNDTGTIHMAACAGVRCLGIFSSHCYSGEWYPYGKGHSILRTRIECEGCGLVACIEKGSVCIRDITSNDVIEAAAGMLTNALADGPPGEQSF
jgi:ADP-heptose:LPS heptosyltransferase